MRYDKYVDDKTGTISKDKNSASVDGYTYHVNDFVPYKNSHSNNRLAKIVSFKKIENGCVWFNGIDEKTKANVYYGLHCSLSLQREIDDRW